MTRRIGTVAQLVEILLQCGCRVSADFITVFDTKTYACPWGNHGNQKWIRFDPASLGYHWQCRRNGCRAKRNYGDRVLLGFATARSHARIHGHTVWVFAGSWKGLEIVPDTLDGLPDY